MEYKTQVQRRVLLEQQQHGGRIAANKNHNGTVAAARRRCHSAVKKHAGSIGLLRARRECVMTLHWNGGELALAHLGCGCGQRTNGLSAEYMGWVSAEYLGWVSTEYLGWVSKKHVEW